MTSVKMIAHMVTVSHMTRVKNIENYTNCIDECTDSSYQESMANSNDGIREDEQKTLPIGEVALDPEGVIDEGGRTTIVQGRP